MATQEAQSLPDPPSRVFAVKPPTMCGSSGDGLASKPHQPRGASGRLEINCNSPSLRDHVIKASPLSKSLPLVHGGLSDFSPGLLIAIPPILQAPVGGQGRLVKRGKER